MALRQRLKDWWNKPYVEPEPDRTNWSTLRCDKCKQVVPHVIRVDGDGSGKYERSEYNSYGLMPYNHWCFSCIFDAMQEKKEAS